MNALTNAVVVVTGAGSGIGRELVLQAAQEGTLVIGTDINDASLNETKDLAAQRGKAVAVKAVDASDRNAVEMFASQVVPTFENRRLVLVNNAGAGLMSGTFQETSLDDFDWLIRVNLWSAIYHTKVFLPYMLAQKRGHIVNLSSVFGLVGVENQSAYCTSKFAVRGFTETLRMELKGTGVTATCVHPGGIKTNIVRNARITKQTIDKAAHQHSMMQFENRAGTTAASAAQQILEAVERKKQRLLIGKDAVMLDALARLLPVGYTNVIRRQIEKAFPNRAKKQATGPSK